MTDLNLQRGGFLATFLIFAVTCLGVSAAHADTSSYALDEEHSEEYNLLVVPGEMGPSAEAVLSSDVTCSNLVDAGLMTNILQNSDIEIVCEDSSTKCFELWGIKFYGNATISGPIEIEQP